MDPIPPPGGVGSACAGQETFAVEVNRINGFCLISLLKLGAATFFRPFDPAGFNSGSCPSASSPVQSGVAPMKLKICRRLEWGSVLSSSVVMLSTDCCGNPRFVALIGEVSNEVVVFGSAVLIAFHWIDVMLAGK